MYRTVSYRLPPFLVAQIEELARRGRKPKVQVVIDAITALHALALPTDTSLSPSQLSAGCKMIYGKEQVNV